MLSNQLRIELESSFEISPLSWVDWDLIYHEPTLVSWCDTISVSF